MKKHLLTAALGLLGASCAFAQSSAEPQSETGYFVEWSSELTPVTTLTDGGKYFLYDAGKVYGSGDKAAGRAGFNYVNCEENYIRRERTTTISSGNVDAAKYVFIAHQVGDNWQFEHMGTHQYLPVITAETKPNIYLSENPGSWSLIPGEEYSAFLVKSTASNQYLDGTETTTVTWTNNNTADLHWYQFFSVDDANATKTNEYTRYRVTVHSQIENHEQTSVHWIKEGESVATHFPGFGDDFEFCTTVPENLIIGADNTEFNLNWEFPFELNHVYRAKLKPTESNRYFLKYNGTNALNNYDVDDEAFRALVYLWYFDFAGFNAFKPNVTFHTLAKDSDNGATIVNENNSVATFTGTPTALIPQKTHIEGRPASDFILKHSSANFWFNEFGNNGKLSTWQSARTDAGSVIRLSELTEDDYTALAAYNSEEDINAAKANPTPANVKELFVIPMTLTVYDNTVNKVYKTITKKMYEGQEYDIAIPFIKERATGVFSSEEPNVTLYGTPDLPFAYSLTTEGELPWQAAHQNRAGDSKWWKYTADNDANLLESNNAEYDNKATVLDDSRLWTFVGNLVDGFKIYNKAAGLNKPLHKNGDAVVIGESSENNTWFVFLNKTNDENACCFKGANTNYFNAQGNSIKFWSDADNGSTSRFQAVATPLLGYSEGMGHNADSNAPFGVVGRPTTAPNCDINAAREAATANKYDYAAATALSEAIAAHEDEEVVTFDSAIYYRLLNKQARNYLVSGKDDNMNIFGGEGAPLTNHNSIVKFVPTGAENTYNIVSQDYYFGKLGALEAQLQQVATTEGAGNYQIVAHNSEEGVHFIKDIDQDLMHAEEARGLMNCIHYWAGGGNSIIPQVDAWEPSKWYLEPATEIEVALTFTDGSYNVALAYFPFPVVCADGSTLCTIYEGTYNTTGEKAVSYTEVQSMPAYTAFLIRNNEANTAKLAIDYQGISTASNNGSLLAGSNRAISAQPGDYVLADSEKGLAFVKQAEAATVAGNFAYIPAANVSDPNTEIYPFASPDMVTGIVDINADEAAEKVIYDLQGRRVNKAAKGVYIINGNKVYVK